MSRAHLCFYLLLLDRNYASNFRCRLQRGGSLCTQTHSIPQKFLQAGVTEAVSTGGHLDGLPHRFAAERTLEASLWLLQELVIKPGHGCRFCRFCRAFGCRLKVQMSSRSPPQTGLSSCAAVKPMRGSYHVPSAADGSGSADSSSRSAQLSDGNKGWTVRDRLEKRFSLRSVYVGRQSCYSCADDSSGDAELTH